MEDPSTVDLFEVLDLCCAIELASARLYHTFASQHGAHPSLVALWRKVAREEENHAAQFNLAKVGKAAMVTGANVTVDDLRAMKAKLDDVVNKARSSVMPPRAAISLAIELEDAMDRVHTVSVLVFAQPSHKRLFEAMMAADREHAESLRRALPNYE
jgi:hypothetical protein